MAEAIIYCDRCGKLILPSDIVRGTALAGGDVAVCRACADGLTPEERNALRSRGSGEAAAGATASRRSAARGARPRGAGKAPFRTGIVVVGLAAGTVAGVAVALLGARVGSPAPGASPVAARPGPEGGREPPEASGASPATPAGRRLAEIKLSDPALGNFAETGKLLREFLARFPDAPEAAEAEGLLARLDAEFDGAAEEALGKAARDAEALASAGGFDEAAKALEEVRGRFGESEWFAREGGSRLDSILEKIRGSRLEAAKGAVARARALARAGSRDDARKVLAGRAAWPGEVRGAAEELLEEIASAEAVEAAERRAEEAWSDFLIDISEAGKAGIACAEACLERNRKGLAELGHGARIARIESHLRPARLVEEMAEIAFRGARGTVGFRWKDEDISGKVEGVEQGVLRVRTTRGRELSVPIGEIAAEDVVEHSRVMLGFARDLPKAGSYYLLRGEPRAARKVIRDSPVMAVALEEDIDAVILALDARQVREREAREAAAARPGPNGGEPMTSSDGRGQTPQAAIAGANSDVLDPVGAIRLGVGNAGLLGGDMTDPEDDIHGQGDYARDLPEGQLRPREANWLEMKCAPANPPGTPPHQRHAYQSWVGSPACAVFLNKPQEMKWYVSFKEGGYGGPTAENPYYVAVKFATPFMLTHFTITTSPDMPGRDPRSWAIQGSNSGEKNEWVDVYRCNTDDRDGGPLRENPRGETLLFTSFTSADMAQVASSTDVEKLKSRLDGREIGIAHFPRQTRAYAWYRLVVYSCFNPNGMNVANPERPPGFALGQLEFFGIPAAAPPSAVPRRPSPGRTRTRGGTRLTVR